ncbi:MAG: hypothetical protein Q8P40_06915 [Nitrospirota bacterium]|nr:hypothetical protein [Nitrospirota bacterium]
MKKKNDKPVIRTINLKLEPKDDVFNYFDDYINFYSLVHDTAVNRYIQSGQLKPLGIKGAMKDYLNPAQKEEFRKELRDLGCSGTFIDLAIGKSGASAYYKTQLKKARKDILFRDSKIRKLESESPNLLKLRSVWYPPINDAHGECAMCGKKGEMTNKSNEFDEYLCDVCFMDFRKFRQDLKFIQRRYISKFFFLCKKIAEENEISQSLRKLLEKYSAPNVILKNTVTDKAGMKKFNVKIDWDNKTVSMKTHSGETMQTEFLGENYYSNFPQYGYMAGTNKFKKLITDFLNKGGYPSLLRHRENGQTDFYLSIPTHYPAPQTKLPVRGYIIVSARSVLLYINRKIEFIKLNKIYFKKWLFESKRAKISKINDELLLFEWNQVGKYNRKLLKNLKNKLGFVWGEKEKPEVIKSEDGKTIRISAENVTAEISLDHNGETAILTSNNGDKRTLYVVETQSKTEKYTVLKIYLQKPVPMPRKYSEGNLQKYIKHQNQITARIIIEKIKPELPENSGVVLIDYLYLHSEGEGVVTPISTLNNQIKNMLQYEGIYAGSINWTRLKKLVCLECNNTLEKAENRYIIRDILLSNINSWICDCNHTNKINNPLIVVAKNMENNVEELLKPLTNKEKTEGELLEAERIPVLPA